MTFTISLKAQYQTIAYVKVKLDNNENSGLFKTDDYRGKSLIEYIVENTENGKISPFYNDAKVSHEFDTTNQWGSNIISVDDLKKNLGYRVDTILEINPEDGELIFIPYETEYNLKSIVEYIIIENRTYSNDGNFIKKEIVGLLPIRFQEMDLGERSYSVAWIYYPDIEPLIDNEILKNILSECNYKGEIMEDPELYYITSEDSSHMMEFQIYPELCPKYSFSDEKLQIVEYKYHLGIDLTKVKYVKYQEEVVSIEHKENIPLFEPRDSLVFGVSNIVNIILNAVFYNNIPAYDNNPDWVSSYDNEYIPTFEKKLTFQEIHEKLGSKHDTLIVINPDTGEELCVPVYDPYNPLDIQQLRFAEYCYYDFNDNLIYTEIIGICPIIQVESVEKKRYYNTFWIKFDEIAQILASKKIFKLNAKEKRSFYQVLYNKNYYAEKESIYDKYDADEIGIDKVYFDDLYVNIRQIRNSKIIFEESAKKTKTKKFKTAKIVTVEVEKTKENLPLFMQYEYHLGYLGLFDNIFFGVADGLSAYSTKDFIQKIDTADIKKNMGQKFEKITIEDFEGGYYDVDVIIPYNPAEITKFVFEEIWLYNKKGEIIGKEIISICPIRQYYSDIDIEKEKPIYSHVFWIKFKDFEDYFQKVYVNKVSPVADETVYEYLQKRKYKFDILQEEEISVDEAWEIIRN